MNKNSWLDRNQQWVSPLVGSFMLMTVLPLLQFLSSPEQPIHIPSWVNTVSLIAGCIGLAVSGLQARLSGTRTAQLICAVAVVLGYALAVFLMLKMLGI